MVGHPPPPPPPQTPVAANKFFLFMVMSPLIFIWSQQKAFSKQGCILFLNKDCWLNTFSKLFFKVYYTLIYMLIIWINIPVIETSIPIPKKKWKHKFHVNYLDQLTSSWNIHPCPEKINGNKKLLKLLQYEENGFWHI